MSVYPGKLILQIHLRSLRRAGKVTDNPLLLKSRLKIYLRPSSHEGIRNLPYCAPEDLTTVALLCPGATQPSVQCDTATSGRSIARDKLGIDDSRCDRLFRRKRTSCQYHPTAVDKELPHRDISRSPNKHNTTSDYVICSLQYAISGMHLECVHALKYG